MPFHPPPPLSPTSMPHSPSNTQWFLISWKVEKYGSHLQSVKFFTKKYSVSSNISIIIQDKWLFFRIENIVHFRNNSISSVLTLNPLLCSRQFQAISEDRWKATFSWFSGAFPDTEELRSETPSWLTYCLTSVPIWSYPYHPCYLMTFCGNFSVLLSAVALRDLV